MATGRESAASKELRALWSVGSVAGLTDGELLERFAARRDEAAEVAFGALVVRHGPMVLGLCRRVLGDAHAAEDAFQATFLVLARKAGAIQRPELLGPWLHGVALRTARKARSRDQRLPQADESAGAKTASPHDPPEALARRREEAEALHEEVGRLPEKYRQVVVLCDLEGLTHEEAGRRLGSPAGTISVRLMRAREMLRSRLTRRSLAPTAGILAAVLTSTSDAARAAVSEPLKLSTIEAASAFVTGGRAAVEVVPVTAAALAEGVLHAMFLTRCKLVAAVCAITLLTGVCGYAIAQARFQPPPVASVGPEPPSVSKTTVQDESQDLAEFRRIYVLPPDKALVRIDPVPALPVRMADAYVRFPFMKENQERRGRVLSLTYLIHGDTMENPSVTFTGDNESNGIQLLHVIENVAGIYPQDMEGDDDLLETEIPGDFLARADAPKEKILAELEAILRDDLKLPVRLQFRKVQRDVVAVRGRWEFHPVEPDDDTIQIYGATLTPGVGGGATGPIDEFLQWAGRFVEPPRRFVNEVQQGPEGEISWHLNYRQSITAESKLEDRDTLTVLKHLQEQTGLTYTPETREVSILDVRREQ